MSTQLQNDQNRIIGMNLRIDKIGVFSTKIVWGNFVVWQTLEKSQ